MLAMNQWIVNKLVGTKDVSDSQEKQKVGTKASIIGILCNLLLFAFKGFVGLVSGSITIISDGLNNLSDCASCVISMWGYKMAAKPADKDHPYGHGRAEYVATFVIAVLILLVGFECASSSLEKIIHPQHLNVDIFTVIVLVGSIIVKLWMGFFYKAVGTRIDNSTLMASSQDSFNDSLITLASLVAIGALLVFDFNVDGFMGLAVSIFILYSAIQLVKDTVEQLIGQTPDSELIQTVSHDICDNDIVLGVHDMMLHYYGNEIFASVHVEVDCGLDILKVHDIIDNIEHEMLLKHNVHLTIHMDPVEVSNPRVNYYKELVKVYVSKISDAISVHDFRVVSGPTHDNCVFDIDVPFDISFDLDEFEHECNAFLTAHAYQENTKVFSVVQLDRH